MIVLPHPHAVAEESQAKEQLVAVYSRNEERIIKCAYDILRDDVDAADAVNDAFEVV